MKKALKYGAVITIVVCIIQFATVYSCQQQNSGWDGFQCLFFILPTLFIDEIIRPIFNSFGNYNVSLQWNVDYVLTIIVYLTVFTLIVLLYEKIKNGNKNAN